MKDIVCGMGVEGDDPNTFSKNLNGAVFFFCSPECMMLLTKDPKYYTNSDMRKEPPMAKDPVCGMEVDEMNPPFTAVYKGKTYYFCCNSCKRDFECNPEKFIKKKNRNTI